MRIDAEILNLDLYATLGVPRSATAERIRATYRILARRSHPDLHPLDPDAGRTMARLNLAARVLLDPALRAAYDRAWARARGSRTASGTADPPRDWYERPGSDDPGWNPAPPRIRNEHRLVLAALCIVLGSGLLVLSRPSNAFWTTPAASMAELSPW